MAFVRKGVFVKHVGRRQLLADANHMVFFSPDHPYRISHPAAGGDDCTAFSFRPGIVHAALAGTGGARSGHPPTFPADHVLDEAGLTIHRYLNRLRLRAGLERLVDGAEGLTGIALDVGFSSHAHFTEAFRREFGLPPSAFRRDLTPAVLRQMSKNLKADVPPTPVSSP